MSDRIQYLRHQDFIEQVENSQLRRPVLVDFSAEARCAPCRMLAPALDKLREEFGDSIDIVKVNVDSEPELANRFRIRGIPTVKLFRQGEVVASATGVMSYSKLREFAGQAPA